MQAHQQQHTVFDVTNHHPSPQVFTEPGRRSTFFSSMNDDLRVRGGMFADQSSGLFIYPVQSSYAMSQVHSRAAQLLARSTSGLPTEVGRAKVGRGH